jgi:hypothetical protein
MTGMDSSARPAFDRNRLALVAIICVCLMLSLLTAGCWLSVAGVYERVVPPPAIALQLGSVEFDAPCPAHGFDCDPTLPFYSIWRGDQQPDGSILYHQLYFVWLKPHRSP